MRAALAIISLLLALTVGVLAGITADQYFRLRTWRDLVQQRRMAAARMATRSRDPRQWVQDSARMAAFERTARERWGPREIARYQAMMHCAVSFQFRDTLARHMQLMNARAWDRNAPGITVAEGWAFKPGGIQQGDTVTVVLPNVWCRDLVIGSFGTASTISPKALGLDVR
jgi:hypothetical protein